MTVHDIIVVGGGLTGVAAAVAAAREGADVLLIERYGYAGGMATAGLVNPFMPSYKWDTWKDGAEVIGGIFQEMLDRLDAEDALMREEPARGRTAPPKPRIWGGNTAFDSEALKWIIDAMLEEAGVDVRFHTFAHEVMIDGERIGAIRTASKSGVEEFSANVFVDTTGDADLACRAGVPTTYGRKSDGKPQTITLMFRMGDLDMDAIAEHGLPQGAYQQAMKEGKLKHGGKRVLVAFGYPGEAVSFNQNELQGFCPVDADDLTGAEIEGRKAVRELVHWLRENAPGFERCRVEQIAPQVGIRESRRIVGEFVLDWEHLLDLERFEDTVACGAYPVDIHDPEGEETPMRKLPEGEWYDIPYRAFLPRGCENLLVAGRCLSATHEAAASVRIMPICTAMGQAAGIAAAQAAAGDGRVAVVDISAVRSRLRQSGAFLG
jgi:hypothetical protein